MAAFQYPTEQQFGPSFVTSNPYQVTGAAVIPPTNPPAQHPNNSKAFTPGKKRKLPDNQHDGGIPNKQPAPQPAQQFFCEICNVQLNSLTQAAQHKQGKTHKLNAAKVDQLGSGKASTEENTSSPELDPSTNATILPKDNTKQQGSTSLECVICSKKFNSKTQAEQHFYGQSHKRKLQAAVKSNKTEPGVPPVSTAEVPGTLVQEHQEDVLVDSTAASETALSAENVQGDELYCEFCCMRTNSLSQMEAHLKGSKHKNAVAKAATFTLPVCDNSSGSPPKMFFCEDCSTDFNSQIQLVQHLTSPKHLNRVKRGQMQQQGQFRGATRGRGRGQSRGRGALRGGQNNRGRGRGRAGSNSSITLPPISSSFVQASGNSLSAGNQVDAFFPQSSTYSQDFTGGTPSFQQPYV